ncbi:YfkD-like protein [Pelagirhabdus alkalitolerans]|uniref:YfkD-like protein n=1 Tax=Pelagirhabdus alkalitolerans TaxID=1612202 RepID=A0A1G6IHM0_9BACI|nr:YfkD family protein [Pelagirhabdus alkalitolerans]SDC05910.1 YfkD-like protein [Pelagirhabdus alkalitolerans]
MRYIMLLCLFSLLPTLSVFAETEPNNEPKIISVESFNTEESPKTDTKEVEKEEWVKEVISEIDEPITNPYLIDQLNQTTIHQPFFSFGSRSEVFLGRWVLNYQSDDTETNWLYQNINENELTNDRAHYVQEETVEVSGGLQVKVDQSDQVQMMLLEDVRERIDLPVNDRVRFGEGTEVEVADLANENRQMLKAYAGAIKETGHLQYGDVYLKTKGRQKSLVIKNIIEQDMVAWLPINQHIAIELN